MSSNVSAVGGKSPRKRKAGTHPSSPADKVPRPPKKCERRVCSLINATPFCFVQASEKCARSGHTSRWYHISAGQHFCNECFEYFYRSNKPGNAIFTKWASIWDREAGDRIPSGPKTFLIDQYLPVWVQCTNEGCRKWRKLPPSIDLRHVKQEIVKCSNCSYPLDEVVSMVKNPEWINTVSYIPLLRYSILSPLLSEYVPDGVGISPTTIHHVYRMNLLPKQQQQQQQMQHQTQQQQSSAPLAQQQGSVSTQQPTDNDSKPTQNAPASLSGMVGLTGAMGHPPLEYDPLHPFNHPQEGSRARAFTPDNMEPEEIEAFQDYYKLNISQGKNGGQSPKMEVYCIMRNLILALWFYNHKVYLTAEKCLHALSLRGLIRIWCSYEVPRILAFLTELGYVNCGFLTGGVPRPFPSAKRGRLGNVIIIGAGTAGLAAAYHLRNFGYSVMILEASGRIGGRVKDNYSLGPCIGLGAMFITGICNNPLTLLARQLGLSLRLINEGNCELINEQGLIPDKEMDKMVEKQFNQTLDKLQDWRMQQVTDVPLGTKLAELHSSVLAEDRQNVQYNREEAGVLDFHYSNLEFACGATLNKVSSIYWDHNDNFPQFSGCHALLPSGYMSILSKLAKGFDIKYDSVVRHVEIVGGEGSGDGGSLGSAVRLTDTRGNEWLASKVIVTVPLAVLKSNVLTFSPPLSERKKSAIDKLGAGLVEKVALKFPHPFWRKTAGPDADFFGHICNSSEQRGMFGVFYDLSTGDAETNPHLKIKSDISNPPPSTSDQMTAPNSSTPHLNQAPQTLSATSTSDQTLKSDQSETYILVTTVSGEALNDYQKLPDVEIISRCVKTLQLMFSEESVPPPTGYVVSRWGADPFAQMSYSYAAVGSCGEDYDCMAEDVGGRVFFAGEATNRQHPQTVTGAYLSGLREASKIIRRDKYNGMF